MRFEGPGTARKMSASEVASGAYGVMDVTGASMIDYEILCLVCCASTVENVYAALRHVAVSINRREPMQHQTKLLEKVNTVQNPPRAIALGQRVEDRLFGRLEKRQIVQTRAVTPVC